jgi:hypothetical protein
MVYVRIPWRTQEVLLGAGAPKAWGAPVPRRIVCSLKGDVLRVLIFGCSIVAFQGVLLPLLLLLKSVLLQRLRPLNRPALRVGRMGQYQSEPHVRESVDAAEICLDVVEDDRRTGTWLLPRGRYT